MNERSLHRLFIMILAGSTVAARGYGCGSCPDSTTEIIPLLPERPGDPPSAPAGDAGDAGDAELVDAAADACALHCPNAERCVATEIAGDGGTIPALECSSKLSCGAGRRPRGYVPAEGAFLAQLASLESAAVDAFRTLRDDLAALGASRGLLRAVSRARRDEVRHTRLARALVGSKRRPRPVPAPRAPSVFDLARDNAVEGCVRETFGALQALAIARTARDPKVRATFERIGRDETRHAALSFRIFRFLDRRLSPRERAAVEAARHEEASRLARESPALAGPLFAAAW